MSREARVLETRGRRVALGPRVWLMGIVNVTPDSFSDGGLYANPARAVERGLELLAAGADIVDIGGESTRPGSRPVPETEELGRVLPVVEGLRRQTKALLSIDTTKAAVARAALDAGADIVNDTSAFRFDPAMPGVVARSGAAAVLMHMRGTPLTMQQAPRYDDVIGEIAAFLDDRVRVAEAAGIPRQRVVVDPGIGFGKTVDHNLEIIRRQADFLALGRPLLLGFSRKAFLGAVLGLPPGERLEGTIAAAVLSVERGAHILRVHDVGPVARAVRAAEAVLGTDRGAADEAAAAGSPGKDGHVR